MAISTHDLSELPEICVLEKISQSLAMLDAILCPEWDSRYFSFNAKWDVAAGERMASMRNGQGDDYFLLFMPRGAILKGFDHESKMSNWVNEYRAVWPGVLDHVPAEFAQFLNEPAFSMSSTTFCIWRTAEDTEWRCGPVSFPEGHDPDGSEGLLWALDGSPLTYVSFAEEYFEVKPDLGTVEAIFRQQPLTEELAHRLNPEREYSEVVKEAVEIGYPAI